MSTQWATVALVTGAGRQSGIGFAVCRQLGKLGMEVILTARSAAAANLAAEQLASEGLNVRGAALDVTDAASIAALAGSLDRLDVLVNNAAGFADWQETASGADLAATRQLFEANLFGPCQLTQALLPLLRQSLAGRIVNVTSGAGSHGDPAFGLGTSAGTASYGVSKAALNALSHKLAVELAQTPILVNAVCPGLTATAPGMEAMGARPVADGAASVVWAVTLPQSGPSGGFFRDGKPLAW